MPAKMPSSALDHKPPFSRYGHGEWQQLLSPNLGHGHPTERTSVGKEYDVSWDLYTGVNCYL